MYQGHASRGEAHCTYPQGYSGMLPVCFPLSVWVRGEQFHSVHTILTRLRPATLPVNVCSHEDRSKTGNDDHVAQLLPPIA